MYPTIWSTSSTTTSHMATSVTGRLSRAPPRTSAYGQAGQLLTRRSLGTSLPSTVAPRVLADGHDYVRTRSGGLGGLCHRGERAGLFASRAGGVPPNPAGLCLARL